jgi:hypothetical protein
LLPTSPSSRREHLGFNPYLGLEIRELVIELLVYLALELLSSSIDSWRPDIAPQRFDDASAAVTSTGCGGIGHGAARAERSSHRVRISDMMAGHRTRATPLPRSRRDRPAQILIRRQLANDIADVAVAVLLDDAYAGKTLELTGPRLVTFGEAAVEIAKASGRDVRYVPVSFERYAELLGAVMSAEDVPFLIDLFRHILDGHNAHTTDGVARVLGRPARDFRAFAQTAAGSGAWQS